MVEIQHEEADMYENSKRGVDSLRIDKGVDHLIYISDTDLEEGHQ
jgi:hypothetical protein